MRRLAFFLCLAFLGLPICAQQESELPILLASLRSEIAFLQSCLTNIGDELNTTKLYMADLSQRNEVAQTTLRKRIEYLETESQRLAVEKSRLEADYRRLSESGDLSIRLKQEFSDYRKQAEGQVLLWKIVAAGEAVAIVAGLIYLMVR